MNRRRAIFSIFLFGGGAITYSWYEWHQQEKLPDFKFLESKEALIADLAEVIIPATSTPGAKDVMAQKAIISLIKDCADRKTQNNFIQGLKDIVNFSEDKFGKGFTALAPNQQKTVLGHFHENGSNFFSGKLEKAKNKIFGKSFFEILKYYTTIAFCTSEGGANNALAYNPIPGKYLSCINLYPGQRSWATK